MGKSLSGKRDARARWEEAAPPTSSPQNMLFSSPQRAALVSVTSNTFLVAIKLAVAQVSGSAARLSEALHSGLAETCF